MSLALDHHTPQAFVDPYAADPAQTTWPAAAAGQDVDYLLPPPNPAERISILIDPRDQRRLALHAVLTAAGIPPRPEDRDAIDQLSALPSSICRRPPHDVTTALTAAGRGGPACAQHEERAPIPGCQRH